MAIQDNIYDPSNRGGSSVETAELQPPQIILCFLSLALQQKIENIFTFIFNFYWKLYAIASFDEPIESFAFVMPRKQFLYHALNTSLCRLEVAKVAVQLASLIHISSWRQLNRDIFSFSIASYSADWIAVPKNLFFQQTKSNRALFAARVVATVQMVALPYQSSRLPYQSSRNDQKALMASTKGSSTIIHNKKASNELFILGTMYLKLRIHYKQYPKS